VFLKELKPLKTYNALTTDIVIVPFDEIVPWDLKVEKLNWLSQ